MSCGCETRQICVGGQTYNAHITLDPRGNFISGIYIDENLATQPISAGVFQWGACLVTQTPQADVVRLIQPLVAGNNVLVHNFGFSSVEVEVRNSTTGAPITARVVAEASNTVTLFVPVAVASARITIDA
jgi:hypothetical protein